MSTHTPPFPRDFRISRERMVQKQLVERGISDPAVLEAMRTVPRHVFVPEALYAQAYEDNPVPIGHGQTISQPYMVGLMTQVLETQPGMTVLEVGTGSGYQTAVLASMKLEVFTVERIRGLYIEACEHFVRMRFRNVRWRLADGTFGWPENAPFDRILVTAGGPDIPMPLIEQLADPGLMVIPVGTTKREQRLERVFKQDGEITAKALLTPVSFVDLIGNHAW